MNIYGIIPARFASQRFPGKMLYPLAGKPLIQRVIEQCLKARRLKGIRVATDHPQIATIAEQCGVPFFMTDPDLPSGSDRIGAILPQLPDADAIINIQGDEPMIDPQLLEEIADSLASHPVVSAITRCADETLFSNPNSVKVVIDEHHNALYFSRASIPYTRDGKFHPFWRHIGIYGYQRTILEQFIKWPEGEWECREKLEQLRFLEKGIPIYLVQTLYQGIGIDTPEDAREFERNLIDNPN